MSQDSRDNQKAGPSDVHWSHDNGHPVLTIGNPLDDQSATAATAIQEPFTPTGASPTDQMSQGSAPHVSPIETYQPFDIHEALSSSRIQGNPELEAKRSKAVQEARKCWRKSISLIPELMESRPLSIPQTRHYGTLLHRVDLALRALIKPSDFPRAETDDHSVTVLFHPLEFTILHDSLVDILVHIKEESRVELLKMCPVPDFPLKAECPTLVPLRDFTLAAALYRSEVETFIRLHSDLLQAEVSAEAAVRRQRRRTSGLSFSTRPESPTLNTIPEFGPTTQYKPISGSPSLYDLPPHLGRNLKPSGLHTDRSLPYRPRIGLPQSHRLSELLDDPTFRHETSIQMPIAPGVPATGPHHYPGSTIQSSHSLKPSSLRLRSTSAIQRPSSIRDRMASSIHRPSSVIDIPSSVTSFHNPEVRRQTSHLITWNSPSPQPFNPSKARRATVATTEYFYMPTSPIRGMPCFDQALDDTEAEADDSTRYSQHTLPSNQYPGSVRTAGFAGSAGSNSNTSHLRQLSHQ